MTYSQYSFKRSILGNIINTWSWHLTHLRKEWWWKLTKTDVYGIIGMRPWCSIYVLNHVFHQVHYYPFDVNTCYARMCYFEWVLLSPFDNSYLIYAHHTKFNFHNIIFTDHNILQIWIKQHFAWHIFTVLCELHGTVNYYSHGTVVLRIPVFSQKPVKSNCA